MTVIHVIGLSYKTAKIDTRENFLQQAPRPEELIDQKLCQEAVLLSTCNRHETYFVAKKADDVAAAFRERIGGEVSLLSGISAVRHLFRVASSLESLVVGETQILGQIRSSSENKTMNMGPFLNRLFIEARQTGALVRRETGLGEGSVSVASIAARLAEKICGTVRGRQVVLLGIGEMGRIFAEYFISAGADVSAASRSASGLDAFCKATGVRPIKDTDQALATADVVITATEGTFLSRKRMEEVMLRRSGRRLFAVDVALPRNIDSAASDVPNFYLYDMENLEVIAAEHRVRRSSEIVAAEAIVAKAAEHWPKVEKELSLKPLLASAYERLKLMENELELEEGLRRAVRLRRRRFFHFAHRALLDGNELECAMRLEGFKRLFQV